MIKKEKIKIVLFVFIIITLLSFLIYPKEAPPPSLVVPDVVISDNQDLTQDINSRIFLEINSEKYGKEITGSLSVYDFMRELRLSGQIDFTEKNYIGIGQFIESINGVKNSRDKSWIYYVNNKKASVGVSNYEVRKGDTVSWKYEMHY